MRLIKKEELKKLCRPEKDSHKGQNGRLLVIGGSKLFHASVFWSADVASRIVDLVHFTSPVMENNELVRKKAKEGFWNGIVVPWERVEEYIKEDDCVLIGPGMPRDNGLMKGEEATSKIVNRLLKKYGQQRWVIDGGALQEMEVELTPKNAILTPHTKEFAGLMTRSDLVRHLRRGQTLTEEDRVKLFAQKHKCIMLFKGMIDIVCSPQECVKVEGGNIGMTKGGTGDVLAGLAAALYCKNEAFFAAKIGSWVNKKAGDNLYKKVGPYFNASDLVEEVPRVIKELFF